MRFMKAFCLAWLAAMLSLGTIAPTLRADEPNVDQIIKEFKGEEKAVERTPEQLQSAYAKVLESLLPKMGGEDLNEQKTAQQTFQEICWRAGRPDAEGERAALCKAVVAKLGADMPKPAKLWLVKQLEHIGRAESVAALTSLLSDQDPLLRDAARRALANNPSPEGRAALLAALGRADSPEWTVALINAIGYRPSPESMQSLLRFAASDDDGVRSASVHALALIGDKSAADAIASAMGKGTPAAQGIAADSYLLLADRLCREGDKATALAMYRKALGSQGYLRCAAIVGLAQAGGNAELPIVLETLADKDPKVQGAALSALQTMPGSDVTQSLTEKAKAAPTELKVTLLRALSYRGDKSALPTLIEAAKDPNEPVRIAAYEGMGRLGDEGAADTLVAALVKTTDAERAAATAALDRIPGVGAVEAIIKGIGQADPKGRAQLVKTLATRRSEKVVPMLLDTAADADVEVRVESFKALADLADEKVLPSLVDLLVKTKEGKDQKEAEKAVAAACRRVQSDDRGAEPVVRAFGAAEAPVKCSLLRVLGKVGGKKAMEVAQASLKDANAEIQDAAVRALADWPDFDAAGTLLDLARSSPNQTHRVLALRGYVRVVGLPSDRPVAQTLKMLEDGMAVAQRPDDKKLVLAGLAEVGDLAALKLAKPYLADDALRAEAATAMIKIAEAASIEHRRESEAALREIAVACKEPAIQQQITAGFQRIAMYDDYVTAWQLSGPYTEGRKNDKQLFDTEFPPEQHDAKDVKWNPISGGADRSKAWKVDLDKILPGNNRVAYLRAWVRSDKDQKARLETGSDDGLKVWVNGEVVSSQKVNRGLSPGQDKVEVALKHGWNSLLLKVTQGGGFWAACARVRATDGNPLPGVLLMGDPHALAAAAADLGDDELKTQAIEVFPKMAGALRASYPEETKAAVKKAIEVAKDETVRKQIADMVEEESRYEDYITAWQVSGPYPEKESVTGSLFDMAFVPEKPDHGGAKWRPIPSGTDAAKPWLMELDKAIGGQSRVAYLRTYVMSPRKQAARLEIGSDDGVKVWLNGKVVHSNNVARPTKAGQDKANVTLEEGWNSLLLKITQGGGQWSACARLRDPNGLHLDGLKVQAETPEGVKFIPAQEAKASGQEVKAPAQGAQAPPKDDLEALVKAGKFKEALALAEKKRAQSGNDPAQQAALDGKIKEFQAAVAKQEEEQRAKDAAALERDTPKIEAAMPAKARATPVKPRKMLVFSVTNGFYHQSIIWCARALETMGKKTGAFETVISNDLAYFEPDKIQQFDAICFNNTTREAFLPKDLARLSPEQQQAARTRDAALKKSLQEFVAGGKGLVGVHAATDSFYEWPEFGKMIGAYFNGHPWSEVVTVKVDDPAHPLCAAFEGKSFEINEEVYQFKEPYSRDELRVLLCLDTAKTNMNKGDKIRRTDGDFALSWIKTYGQGRVFYCAIGHRNELFWNPAILQFYLDGIQFALGDLQVDTTPSAKMAK